VTTIRPNRRGGIPGPGTTPDPGANPGPGAAGGWAASLGVLNPFSGRPAVELGPDRRGRSALADRILDVGIYVALVALVIYFSVASPYFLTEHNILDIGSAVAVTGVLAAGVTAALIAGQLDLTVGSNIALTSVVVAMMIGAGAPTLLAVIAGLAVGCVVGLVNTALVVWVRINSIIATIAMSLVIQAVALILVSGNVKPIINPALQNFMSDRLAGIPSPVVILVVVYLVSWVVLTFTRAGWHVYGVGGNASAALRSGINVRRVYTLVFVGSGLLAALGGVITAGTAGSGAGAYGVGDEFTVLAAVLLGGIGLSGGSGRVQRTFAGVLVIGVINDGLTLLSVGAYYQQLAQGVIFVLAVVLGAIGERRRAR
jgi:ribose transport system permease protein